MKKDEMSFLDHLEELRWRVVKALLAIGICAIPCGIYWRKILDVVMIYPLHLSNPRPHIIFTTPAEAVVLSLKVAIAGGFILATPVVFYQIWAFVAPGLYKTERKIVLPSVIASTFCFLLGVGVSYVFLPYMVKFLSGFAAGVLEPMFKADDYMSFLIKIVLAFGLVFELPVASFVLTRMGVITPKFLVQKFRYAIVAIFVVAAVLTPPDVISQICLALPLLLLYGVSILVSWLAKRKT